MGNEVWFSKSKQPEHNRLIRCKGHDWSAFECEGMMIPYKEGSPKKLRGKARFCGKQPDGSFMSDRKTWLDVEQWRYVSDVAQPVDSAEDGK